jgi:hypothetical protein
MCGWYEMIPLTVALLHAFHDGWRDRDPDDLHGGVSECAAERRELRVENGWNYNKASL